MFAHCYTPFSLLYFTIQADWSEHGHNCKRYVGYLDVLCQVFAGQLGSVNLLDHELTTADQHRHQMHQTVIETALDVCNNHNNKPNTNQHRLHRTEP